MIPNAFPPVFSTVFTSAAATLANVVGLTGAVNAGGTYRFHFYGAWSGSSTAVTLRLSLTFPAAPTLLNFRVSMANAQGGVQTQLNFSETISSTSASTAAVQINTRYPWEVEGVIRPSVAGAIQLQACNQAASGTLTIPAGAVLLMAQEV